MRKALRRSSRCPVDLLSKVQFYEADRAVFTVRASSGFGFSMRDDSGRVHSRYRRRVTDLPLLRL